MFKFSLQNLQNVHSFLTGPSLYNEVASVISVCSQGGGGGSPCDHCGPVQTLLLEKRAVGLQLKGLLIANALTVKITEICRKTLTIFDSQESHQTFKFHTSTNNFLGSRQRRTRGMCTVQNMNALRNLLASSVNLYMTLLQGPSPTSV